MQTKNKVIGLEQSVYQPIRDIVSLPLIKSDHLLLFKLTSCNWLSATLVFKLRYLSSEAQNFCVCLSKAFLPSLAPPI